MHRSLALVLGCLLATTAAAVPLELSHQGRLSDSAGAPLTGSHTLTFSLYDSASATTAFWTEDHTTDLDAGYFSVVLGSQGSAINTEAFAGDTVFLGISVDGDAELGDRLPLLSVPYALRADVATSVTGGPIDATEIKVGGNVVVDSDGGISFSSLTGVPTDSDTLADLTGCADGNIAVFDGADWGCAAPTSSGTVDVSTLDGTINIANLPVGADADKVAAGDHTHTAADVGALPITGGTLTGGLAGTTADFSGSIALGDDSADCNGGKAGTLRFTGDALMICANDAWSQVWPDAYGSQSAAAKSCADLLDKNPTAQSGVYYLDPKNTGSPFKAYCDMDTDGGGWTMCYTGGDASQVLIKTQVTYDESKPLGTQGYRSDCRDIPFSEVVYVNHSDGDKAAWFSKDSGTPVLASDGYNVSGNVHGDWTGHGEARNTWKYQLNVCSEGWMQVGFMLTGSVNSCRKACNSWCSDTTSDYYRIDGDTTNNSYNGAAFRENGHRNLPVKTLSVGIR